MIGRDVDRRPWHRVQCIESPRLLLVPRGDGDLTLIRVWETFSMRFNRVVARNQRNKLKERLNDKERNNRRAVRARGEGFPVLREALAA
jgi:hypothetical protein